MRYIAFLLTVVIFCASTPARSSHKIPVDYVDPFIGTSNSRWTIFPGPCLPFGMVKLSPDNQGNSWNGGYEYSVLSISGFSHLHSMSISGLSIMPTTGPIQTDPSSSRLHPGEPDGPFGQMWTAGYRSRFLKETEAASPGYYAVYLADYQIKAELSATLRCGFLRFTFPQTRQAHILLNLDFPAEEATEVLSVELEQTAPNELVGSVQQRNNYAGEHTYYFIAQFSKPPELVQVWKNEPYAGTSINYGIQWRRPCHISTLSGKYTGGTGCGLIANYSTAGGEQVTVRTAISFVSVENARLNLQTEAEPFGWNLDAVVAHAREVWSRILERIEVQGGSEDEKRKLYTCLYRTFTGKGLLNDVNGQYRDAFGNVQQLKTPANAVYSSDGFWGTQWNLTPLWTLIAPEYAESMVNSLLELASRGGWIPEAPVALKYSPIMGAQHHNALIISCYQKGLRNFDVNRAYEAIKHDLSTPGIPHPSGGFAGNRHLSSYLKYGYVADEDGPISSTMEYAYDDWCFAQFARARGNLEDAQLFLKRSGYYTNAIDPSVGYARRRHQNGNWVEPFDPFAYGTEGGWNGPGFMEGNAWVYTYFVPHDLPGLARLLGTDKLSRRLEQGFREGHVDLSNQPNLQAPFLFNYLGKPWLTQKFSRLVAKDFYSTSPYFGWKGEEDEGQLSALYVLFAMGLFEMDGGCSLEPAYDLSSPVFDIVTLHLNPKYFPGRTFTIEAHGNSDRNVYIQKAELNGRPLQRPFLPWAAIRHGGTLRLTLAASPNTRWGLDPNNVSACPATGP